MPHRADERIHEVEEGARQHMMAQARTFQARLELLYHEGEQLSVHAFPLHTRRAAACEQERSMRRRPNG